ncbi:CBS domain-containing protein [Microbacterium sp. M28]|uniref:CBS domain-containing protein n=1 Tax=Microbacterium sp. M28 TaxID=2962064 RepID=UPI0029907BF6|nr:CBS domain-containing protein [Microbacterium sp. M28]
MSMTLVSDIMTPGARCIGENDSLHIAATVMAELDVGALPICGEDSRLKGMLTDRDIVVKAVANGMDPETTRTGVLAEESPSPSRRPTTSPSHSRACRSIRSVGSP